MKSESKRTPGKWAVSDVCAHWQCYRKHAEFIIDRNDFEVATVKGDSPEEAEANARYICRACNNFEALLEAAKPYLTYVGCPAMHKKLQAAIRAAESDE